MQSIQYTQQDFLGSGGFSNVYKVTINDKVYALKKIHPYLLKDQTIRTTILKQIQIMKQIDHPNIIKYYDSIQNNGNQLSLLLQYGQGGTLYNQLKIHQKLSQQQTVRYLKDIIKAVKYLHSKQYAILHRDIKPENILLSKNGQCKLADFGSSSILQGLRNTFVGTKQYMAPQIMQNLPYGKPIDLWCLGILIYELLIGTLPQQLDAINLPPYISRPAQDVIKRLLIKDPNLRMTLEELQNHIWLVEQQSNDTFNYAHKDQNKDMNRCKKKVRKENLLRRINFQKKEISTNQQDKLNNIKEEHNQLQKQQHKLKQTKRKQSFQQNLQSQKICKSTEAYFNLINLKAQLSIKYEHNKELILNQIDSKNSYKLLIIEQIFRLQQKIKEYKQNIDVLSKSPLKFAYQYENQLKEFIKKIQYFNQYVEYIPIKLQQQITQIPQFNIKTQIKNVPISQYIFKLKNYMLQSKRDALIDLIAAKKKHKSIKELQLNL